MARTLCRSTKKYADIETLKRISRLFFKHITYYYPKTKVPKWLLISEMDWKQVIYADSLVIVSLEMYLG
jgi:hypothetical protein